MATSLTRFEIVLPSVDSGTPSDTAIKSFITSMLTLCQLVMTSAYVYPQSGGGTTVGQNVLYGLISAAQQVTALGFLNTLNAALVAAGGTAVLCTVSTVTSEP
jgi:hypothetical protein